MDDLNEDPQKVAEDIIKQASTGFRQAAADRIIHILNCYQKLQQEIVEPKEQKESQTDIRIEGALAWRIEEGDDKRGPFCARCHVNDKELPLMLEIHKGLWECPKCKCRFNLAEYRMRDDEGRGHDAWVNSGRR